MVLQLKVFVSKINLRFSASFSSFDRYKSSTAARARARQTLEDVSHVPWNPWTRFAQTSLRFQKKGPRKRSEPMFHVLRTRRSKGREGTLSLSLREIRRESIQYWSSRWKRAKEGERIRKYFFFPSRGTIYLVVGVVGRGFVNTRVHIYIYRGKRGLTCVGVDGETAVGLDHRVPEQRVLAEIGIGGAHGSDQRTRGQVLQQLESVKLLLEAGIVVVVVEHRDQHGSARCRGGGTVVGREHRERVSIRALSIEHLRQINPSGVGADSKRRRSLEPVTQPSVVARVQVDRGHLEYLRCIYNRTRLYICINILLRQQGKKKKRVPFGWKDGRKSEREREKEAARRHKRPVYPVVPY